jgi:hypothetical protein
MPDRLTPEGLPEGVVYRLALAVLQGDVQAALPLADAVLESWSRLDAARPAMALLMRPPACLWLPLEPPIRVRKMFYRLGILTVDGLLLRTRAELLETPNFGATSIWQVETALAAVGLSLRP